MAAKDIMHPQKAVFITQSCNVQQKAVTSNGKRERGGGGVGKGIE